MSTSADARVTPEPDGSLAALRRGWRYIVAFAIIGMLLGFAYSQVKSPLYTATATVLVTPTGVQNSADLANGRTNSDINLDTEAKLLRSTDVAARVKLLLAATQSSFELANQVSVVVPPNTEVLAISFTGRSPVRAQAGAHAFAVSYLQQRATSAQALLDDQVKRVVAQSTALTATLRAVSGKLVTLPNASIDRAYTATEKALIQEQLGQLNQVSGRLSTTVVTPGRLLTDAQQPTAPSSPSLPLDLGSGLASGLLVGLALGWLRGRKDTRLRSAGEVERVLGLPVLGSVQTLKADKTEVAGTPESQVYRRLANTLPAVLEGTTGVVLVASTKLGIAGDVVAANLAVALARTDVSATLVQVDRSSHVCADLLGAGAPGSDLPPVRLWSWESGVSASRYVRAPVPDLPDLMVVSGHTDSDSTDPAVGDSGREIVEHLRYRNGYLIAAVPSTAVSADAQALARRVDAVIVVVELMSTAELSKDAIAQFDEVRAPMLGAIVVGPQARPARPARSAKRGPAAPEPDQSPEPAAEAYKPVPAPVGRDVTEDQIASLRRPAPIDNSGAPAAPPAGGRPLGPGAGRAVVNGGNGVGGGYAARPTEHRPAETRPTEPRPIEPQPAEPRTAANGGGAYGSRPTEPEPVPGGDREARPDFRRYDSERTQELPGRPRPFIRPHVPPGGNGNGNGQDGR